MNLSLIQLIVVSVVVGVLVWLGLASSSGYPDRTETLVEANHLTIWPGQSNGRQMPTCHAQARKRRRYGVASRIDDMTATIARPRHSDWLARSAKTGD